MLLIALAQAQELPWECVTVSAPADARPYVDAVRDEADGIEDAGDAALAIAEAWVDTTCLTDCSDGSSGTSCWTGSCTTSAGAWVEYESSGAGGYDGSTRYSSEDVHIVVEPPASAGETWTRLEVTKSSGSRRDTAGTIMPSSEWADWEVSWEGTLDADWIADGAFTGSTSESTYTSTSYEAAWDDGSCAWSVNDLSSATVGGTEVAVTYDWDHCGGYFMTSADATLDGVDYGVVDPDTWADASDDDDDGNNDGYYDCDDSDPAVYLCATETPYDGVDQDCSGADTTDADRDGHDAIATGGTDCDDGSRTVYPGATDTWYDGVDSDCAGNDDYDQDVDGYALGADCDDTDAAVSPAAADTWYDGVDTDCAGNDDLDQDADGYALADDCDDTDATKSPGVVETWYDGIDSDCAGDDDFDQDADGHALGADCDDTDATVNPRAFDLRRDGIDQDCDGDDGPSLGLGPPGEGCSSAPGAAWLAPVALLLVGRRRRRTRD